MKLRTITSSEELLAAGSRWDGLWDHSAATSPILRAATSVQWLRRFARNRKFIALVAEREDGEFVAALPLAGKKVRGVVPAGALIGNPWSLCGDLLLDESVDARDALDLLAGSLKKLPWSLLWLNDIPLHAERWRDFVDVCGERQIPLATTKKTSTSVIPVSGDWEQFRAAWSKNHRKKMTRQMKRLEKTGECRLSIHQECNLSQISELMQTAFEIEDKSWKGVGGTSILRSNMAAFYQNQAETLAHEDRLRVSFLEHCGRPIAFEYGAIAKGVYHSYKVGYDPGFAQYSPGQLLLHELLRVMHDDPRIHAVDCIGPTTDAIAKWRGNAYPAGRIVLAPGGLFGATMLRCYKKWSHRPAASDLPTVKTPPMPVA